MDLDALFTVRDYRLRTLEIRTPREPGGLAVDVWCSPQAATDYDRTGQVLWPVSVLLGHCVVDRARRGAFANRTIVELGAGGTGLPSLAAAAVAGAKRVVATDGNGDVVLELLQKNADHFRQGAAATDHDGISHGPSDGAFSVQQLVWGDRAQLHRLLDALGGPADVILAADVVQWPAVVEPLLHTAKALLWHAAVSDATNAPALLLGIVNRAGATYDLFFRLAAELGFRSRAVPPEEYLIDGVVPPSCQEHGGRVAELFELTLVDRSEAPVLLWEEQDGASRTDHTTGTGFQHSSALPC